MHFRKLIIEKPRDCLRQPVYKAQQRVIVVGPLQERQAQRMESLVVICLQQMLWAILNQRLDEIVSGVTEMVNRSN